MSLKALKHVSHLGMLHYENLSQKSLSAAGKSASNPPNGRLLLPVKLGITDECRHVQNEIKVSFVCDCKTECDSKFSSS